MAKRRYTSKCSMFSMHLDLPNGEHTVLEFKGKNVYTKERYLDVDDPVIQNLFETSQAFGVYFEKSDEFNYLEEEEKAALLAENNSDNEKVVEEIEDEELPENTENELEGTTSDPTVKEFRIIGDAKKWLNEEFGISLAKLGNKTIITEKALELGYAVRFLNDNN